MNLMKMVEETVKLDRKQLADKAKILSYEINNDIKEMYSKSPLFAKYNLTPWELFTKICLCCICSDNKMDKDEYELFLQVTDAQKENFTPADLRKAIVNSDMRATIDMVDEMTDYFGIKMKNLKEKIVEFSLCFMGIDGRITGDEMMFIKQLVD